MHPAYTFLRLRPRLSSAIVAGIVTAFLLPADWSLVTRGLTGWNVTVWLYLCLTAKLMMNSSHHTVRKVAEQEDNTAGVILAIMSVAAIVSLAAIILELTTLTEIPLSHRVLHYAFAGVTVLGSWLLLGTLFTFHYARIFYRSPPERRALRFPDTDENLDYWDFLYFSFTIAVAAQTSDVMVMSSSMRRVVLAQSVLSFLFNAAIIGLSINMAASLVKA
ncbi:MAG: DUF1345 domain-containing protein [Pseudomonadota bacterium]